jgi:hypothetical protein
MPESLEVYTLDECWTGTTTLHANGFDSEAVVTRWQVRFSRKQSNTSSNARNKHRTSLSSRIMGCVESVPVSEINLNVPHPVDPKIPLLGGLPPSSQQQQILIREKMFSWGGDGFKIKRLDGTEFHGMKIQGKAFGFRDQMTLVDAQNMPIAVCLRKFGFGVETFKIYTLHPLYDGQTLSQHDYQGKRLYAYAEVSRVMMSTHHEVKFDNMTSPTLTVHCTGYFPKTRVVKQRGVVAATVNGGSWGGNVNSYKVSMCPGIDPCLIICVTAICDEMEEKK